MSDRIILIKGDCSNWYEQAIFILRKQQPGRAPKDFVAEAENIIANYMERCEGKRGNLVKRYKNNPDAPFVRAPEKKAGSGGIDAFLYGGLIICALVLAYIVISRA
ncbi:MAG: hypothetical protein LBU36_05340 [Clostridiales bacterium]|jgi:hypothetical protein|nr:hypothetical protein [Clostridiales bacterium]